MNRKIRNVLLGFIPFAVLLLAWVLAYIFSWVPHWMLPSPLDVLLGFIVLIKNGTLLKLILISIFNLIPPFLLALVFAIIFGVLIGTNWKLKKIFSPFLGAIYLVPSLAWIPFIILFLGFTRETIWAAVFISSFMKIIYNVIDGVRAVNPNWILAAKNIGLNKFKIIVKIILPGSLPQIITGIRLGFGSAWRSLIGVEMLVVTLGGLGRFIWNAQWTFSFDKVLIGILLIALIGLIMEEFVFKKIEKRINNRLGNIN